MARRRAPGPALLTALLVQCDVTFYTVLCASEAGHQEPVHPHGLQMATDAEPPLLGIPGIPAVAAHLQEFGSPLGPAKEHGTGSMQGWPEGTTSARRRRRTISGRWQPPVLLEESADKRGSPLFGAAVRPASSTPGQAAARRRRRYTAGSGPQEVVMADWNNQSTVRSADAPQPQAAVGSSSGSRLDDRDRPLGQRNSSRWRALFSPSRVLLQVRTGTQAINAAYLALLVLGSIVVAVAAIALYSRSEPDMATVQQQESSDQGKAAPYGQKAPAGCSLPVLLTERSAVAGQMGAGKAPGWQRSASSCSLPIGPSPRLAGPSPRSPALSSQYLCPDLVVPDRMEFVFAVREVLNTARQQISFSIVDLRGQPLSHIIVNESGPHCGIHLQMLDGTPLAWIRTECLYERTSRCLTAGRSKELAPNAAGSASGSVEICRPSGEVFCCVAQDEGIPCYRYVLRSKTWQRLYTYHGNFRQKAVNVTNSSGQLVCTSERCRMDFDSAPHYQVRVAPQTDAGLLLCGLLSIDKLEGGSHTS